jgi:hypothetical protein
MMVRIKARKRGFNLLGYGAIGLYVFLIGVVAAGVYGFNVTSLMLSQSSSERAREQVRIGRMLITTEDRVQCRAMRFNNETSEVSAERLIDCDDARSEDRSGGSLSLFRDGFVNR